jgi:hypothetical protein
MTSFTVHASSDLVDPSTFCECTQNILAKPNLVLFKNAQDAKFYRLKIERSKLFSIHIMQF